MDHLPVADCMYCASSTGTDDDGAIAESTLSHHERASVHPAEIPEGILITAAAVIIEDIVWIPAPG